MARFLVALYVAGFVLGQVGASLSFKMAATRDGMPALWWFVAGNIVGFACPVCLTLALKAAHANVVYALCFGISFCLLQIAAWSIFRQPLSTAQWSGVALIAIGIVLLQMRS